MTTICPTCGLPSSRHWSRDNIVRAMRKWADVYGAQPKMFQWDTAVPGFPTRDTVRRVWGTWNAAIVAAGFEPYQRTWTREDICDAVFQWRYEHGCLPKTLDWARSENGHPSADTCKRRFGSWNNMIVAAGYTPLRGSGVRRGRPIKEAA